MEIMDYCEEKGLISEEVILDFGMMRVKITLH
jgi:hypothetical protein